MNKKKFFLIVVFIFTTLILTGCMPGDGSYTSSNPAGFFWGIWHGWTAPISLVAGLFNKNIRVYEVMNTGWPYDFGFYMAIISGFGGLSVTRKNKSGD
ncbi:MAG: hypothetical protein GX995_08150 [Clostridiales bacterium]|jgi:hypothetical protein|nr:hypothetical protein [Clostridiales bacterium]